MVQDSAVFNFDDSTPTNFSCLKEQAQFQNVSGLYTFNNFQIIIFIMPVKNHSFAYLKINNSFSSF